MKILILNVHSALNLGDDAIMYETLRRLHATFPSASITIAANDPLSWRKYEETQVVGSLTAWVVDRAHGGWRWSKSRIVIYSVLLAMALLVYRILGIQWQFGHPEQHKLLAAYYQADLVLSCGGGNFYAHRRVNIPLIWSYVTVLFGLLLGKRTVFLPQSIGPIEGGFQRGLARLMLNRAAYIMVREPRSLALLELLKVRTPAKLVPDLAFGLPTVAAVPCGLPVIPDDQVRIGVTVINRSAQERSFAGQRAYEDVVAAVLVRISQEYKAQLHIFAQCYGPTPDQNDRYCARKLYDTLKYRTDDVVLSDHFGGALELKSAYSQMDCMIGSRMHTGIFALSTTTPVVLIGYQPKAIGLMEFFGLERFCLPIENVTEATLYELVCEMLDNRDAMRVRLAQRLREIRSMLIDWTSGLQG